MIFESFDSEYVRRLAERDPFVEHHFTAYFSELILIKLRGRLRSPQLIEDISQETLLRVLETVRVKGGVEHPERLGSFVNSVCRNVMLEQIRKEGRHVPVGENSPDPADPSVDLDAPLVQEQRKRQVEKVLAELSERDRSLLRMIFLEEKDKTEVCREFEVDANYLRVLLHRAKARFRETMEKHRMAAI